jgi:transcription initiation factor TFIIIB Brf1 subunit/transcription initiation factor TFIIB
MFKKYIQFLIDCIKIYSALYTVSQAIELSFKDLKSIYNYWLKLKMSTAIHSLQSESMMSFAELAVDDDIEKLDDFADIFAKLTHEEAEDVSHSINPFMCYENDDFASILRPDVDFDSNVGPYCDACKCEMARFELRFVCEKCGCEEEIAGDECEAANSYYAKGGDCRGDSIGSYNTSGFSAAPLRVRGPQAHRYQKKLIGSVSNYKVQQKKNTVEDMKNAVYQSKEAKIPNNVVCEAANLYFEKVQQHQIRRGDVRTGTQAACLYRMCIKYNITRKPKEIAAIFGIPQNDLSNGEKILDDLSARGLIETNKKQMFFNVNDLVNDFIDRYFESLGIPAAHANYKPFVIRLIRFTTDKHIADSSVPSTKCAGAIYILTARCKELKIRRDKIQTACKISKSTFIRYAKAVFEALNQTCDAPDKSKEHYKDCRTCRERKQLRHIFNKYNVPI